MRTDTENKRRNAEKSRKYRIAHPDKVLANRRRYYAKNKEKIRETFRKWYAQNKRSSQETSLAWRIANLPRVMIKDAQKRAAKAGLEFNLELIDVVIPTHCPVLGVPLQYGVGIRTDSSPSLDRFDPKRGYTWDNVRVISWRANNLKSNATKEELRKILSYLEGDL